MRLVTFGLCLGLCSAMAVSAAEPVAVVSATSVQAAQAEATQLTGQVVSRYRLPLSFRVGGQVAQRLVELGESVEANQVLAELDASDFQLALEQNQANLASAQSRLENASRERKRLSKLYKDQLMSLQELQRAETFEIESQQAMIAAQVALKLARNQQQYSLLRAPKAGRISQVSVEAGQWISPGQQAFEFVSGAIEAQVYLPAHPQQQAYQQAILTSVDQPIQCQATLRVQSPVSDAETQQTLARYQLSACSEPLNLGSVIHLTFDTRAEVKQLQVPITAIFNQGHQAFVWHIVDNKVQATPISVVRLSHERAIITADQLSIGDSIVLQGTHRLVAGESVSVLK